MTPIRRIPMPLLVLTLAFITAGKPARAQTEEQTPYAPGPDQQPYFDLLNIEAAWQITRGDPACLVGVIDTGFDFFHPALHDYLVPGYFASGVYHVNSVDMIAHGTAVVAIIVARHTEQDGMVGFAPDCRVLTASIGMPEHALLRLQREFYEKHPDASMTEFQAEMIKHADLLQSFGRDWLDYITRTTDEGIRYLVDHGVRVINISAYLSRDLMMRYPEFAKRLDNAFAYAAQKDVIMVIGAGNQATEVPEYPGTAETVLVVGATTLADERWETTVEHRGLSIKQGSCYGPRLSVMAPMENIRTARPHEEAYYKIADTPAGKSEAEFGGRYETSPTGATSLATPIVTSLVALVRSLRPDLSAAEVVQVVQQGAVDLGEPGHDDLTAYGRVDYLKTLELARDLPKKTPQTAPAKPAPEKAAEDASKDAPHDANQGTAKTDSDTQGQ
ncbi:MAG: S8 family serine peptidase [Planctomycetes bacterium]|nr:S8 family serine peptidase [Planctomycetota bacterium]